MTVELTFDQVYSSYSSLNIESFGLLIECLKVVSVTIEHLYEKWSKSGFEDFIVHKSDVDNI